jgi:hypothetical protein
MKCELILSEDGGFILPPPTVPDADIQVKPNKDCEYLLKIIEKYAVENDTEITKSIKPRKPNESEVSDKIHREKLYLKGKIHYYGGMPGSEFFTVENITYVCGAVAAFAVFVKNILGAAKDWRDLTNSGTRKVIAKLGEEKNRSH